METALWKNARHLREVRKPAAVWTAVCFGALILAATGTGYLPSAVASATHNSDLPQTAKPVFTPGSGTYKSPRTVTITSSTPGASIYYAINVTPTTASTLYTGPITVSQQEFVEAIAVVPGYANSKEVSAFYTIDSTSAYLSSTSGTSPFVLTCNVDAPPSPGGQGMTGNVTFTDVTTGQIAGTVPLGNSQTSFLGYKATENVIAAGAGEVVSADFNGDGKPDLAVATGKGFSILIGNGDGTFQPEAAYLTGAGGYPIAMADLNGDGHLDLVTASSTNGDGSNPVSIVLGNGDGTFRIESNTPTIRGNPLQIVIADFNGDMKPDLAIETSTQSGANAIWVFLGNGDGTFQPAVVTSISNGGVPIVAGNFRGGKYDDIILAGTLTYLQSKGDGTFQPIQLAAATQLPFNSNMIGAADFNGDGNLDLVLTGIATTGNHWIAVLLGNGDGTFQFSDKLAQLLGQFQVEFFQIGHFTSDNSIQVALGGSPVSGSAGTQIFTTSPSGVLSLTETDPEVAPLAVDLLGNGVLDYIQPTDYDSVYVAVPALGQIASASIAPVYAGDESPGYQCSYSGDANYDPSVSEIGNLTFLKAIPPQFSLLVGDYADAQPVAMTDASAGASIYYTTDGTDPTVHSNVYNGPISLTTSTKLKAIAGGDYVPSLISEAVYTITDSPEFAVVSSAVAPKVSPGTVATSETVTMSDKTPGALIYYTTDGTTPSIKSSKYTGAITLTKATTIKAFAALSGLINSPIVAVTFDITQPAIPDIAWTAPRPITYGTPLGDAELDATASNAGTFTYSPRAGTVLGAGAHKLTVTFTPADHAHYTTATRTIQIEVIKKALVVASHLDKVYGAAMPRLTYTLTGFVNGDTAAKAVKGEPVLATTATAKLPVGSYAITITAGTLSSANYSFELSRASILVAKAELKVRAANLVMTQGAAVPTLKYVIDGFVLGDTQSSATKGQPKLTTTATSQSVPGNYPIDVTAGTLAAKNYSFTYDNGTLIVIK